MKVKDLIEKLQICSEDAEVLLQLESGLRNIEEIDIRVNNGIMKTYLKDFKSI